MEELKQKDKYYIPEIEELHIGFEYEKFSHIEGKNIPMIMDIYLLHNILDEEWNDWKDHQIRVKYLDEDDIKELGWEFEKNYPGTTESLFIKDKMLKEHFWLGLEYDFESNYLRIFFAKCNGDTTIFSGTIKNKSELKVLMKQLGICQ